MEVLLYLIIIIGLQRSTRRTSRGHWVEVVVTSATTRRTTPTTVVPDMYYKI
nr:MAG TPA: hypothetical protein [Bacteriophage sp.]